MRKRRQWRWRVPQEVRRRNNNGGGGVRKRRGGRMMVTLDLEGGTWELAWGTFYDSFLD